MSFVFHRMTPLRTSRALACCVLFALAPGSVFSEEIPAAIPVPSITNASFQSGLKSLKENMPDVAAAHFAKALKDGPKKGESWSQQDQTVIRQFLAESYARAGKSKEALELYSSLPLTDENNYWTSVALIRQGSLTKALHWINQISTNDPQWSLHALQARAYIADFLGDNRLLQATLEQLVKAADPQVALRSRIWLANCLLNQQNPQQASQTLQPAFAEQETSADEPSPEPALIKARELLIPYARLTEARILATQGKWDEASIVTARLAEEKNLPVKLKDLTVVALAAIRIKQENAQPAPAAGNAAPGDGQPVIQGSGEDQLLAFISGRPDSPLLAEAFNILVRQNTFLTNPQAYEKLVSWTNHADKIRQPLAAFALADTLYNKKDPQGAITLAKASLKTTPGHPATRKLVLQTINRLISDQQYDEASELIHTYPHKEAEIYFNSGIIAYEQQDYQKAAGDFDNAIKAAGDAMLREAYYNANLNALALGDDSKLASLIQEVFMMPSLQETLAYEQVHYAARQFEPRAIEKLEGFIASYPTSGDIPLARLDLAEVALNIAPPRLDIARTQINLLEQSSGLTEDERVRLACLHILLPESQQIWPDAITACRSALKEFPNSSKAPDIQLKLGELLFKNENFNESLMVLQSFPDQYPKSDLREEAMFLAGKAAQQCDTEATSIDRALEIFRRISNDNNRFAQSADIEIASILSRLKEYHQAISTLDKLLEENPPRQIRLLALSIQAEAWAESAVKDNTEDLDKARNLCTQILDTPNLMPSWRFSALSRRARYAELEGKSDLALDDYYSILSYFPDTVDLSKRDWYWYYTAGFSALRLLEAREDWEKALAMAMQMARTSGPRAREAALVARKIQFDHFIWHDAGDEAFDKLMEQFFPAAEQQDKNGRTSAAAAPNP